jgi:hypothetical protein
VPAIRMKEQPVEHDLEKSDLPRAGETRGWLRRHALALLGSAVVIAGFVAVLRAGALPVVPSRDAFDRMAWWAIPAFTLAWTVVLFVRSARWVYLLAPIHHVPLRRVISVSLIGYAALVLLPFRMGEVVRPALIREKDKLSAWAATGTVGAERITDGLCLSLFFFAALSFSTPLDPLPDHIGTLPIDVAIIPGLAYAALAFFFAAFVAMGAFHFRRDLARRFTRAVVGLVSARLADTLSDAVERFGSGLDFLKEARYSVPFLTSTVAYWALNVGSVLLLAHGCGLTDLTYVEAAVVVGVLALGILTPNAPGFFGAFQVATYAGLAMYVPSQQVTREGAAFVFLLYAIELGTTLIYAGLALVVEKLAVEKLVVEKTMVKP